MHEGQQPRDLQEKGTHSSSRQLRQQVRTKPSSKSPQRAGPLPASVKAELVILGAVKARPAMKKNATKGTRKTSSEAPPVEVLGKGLQLTVALPELLHEELYGVVTRLGLLALQGGDAAARGRGAVRPAVRA